MVDTSMDKRRGAYKKAKVLEETLPHGESLEAVANLRKKISSKDPYFIWKLNDENHNGELTFVFKMSKCQAEIALAMDPSKGGYLSEEYCHGDGTFKRCKGYTTLGLHVYHPLLRNLVRIASMQTPKGSGESKECWEMFFRMLNEVLQHLTGDSGYKFQVWP